MSQLQLNISIDSSQTNGNPTSWQWTIDGSSVSTNPPPRMSVGDTLAIFVIDTNSSAGPFDGFMIMGPKVENPLTGVTGKASPLKSGNSNAANAVCVAIWTNVMGNTGSFNGTQFTFTPSNNVLLEAGAWELTFVVTCAGTLTQFELDPEFDVSTGN